MAEETKETDSEALRRLAGSIRGSYLGIGSPEAHAAHDKQKSADAVLLLRVADRLERVRKVPKKEADRAG